MADTTQSSNPGSPPKPPRKLRKICDMCALRRYRCSGGNPCTSCHRRLFNCHYSYFAVRQSAAPKKLEALPPRHIRPQGASAPGSDPTALTTAPLSFPLVASSTTSFPSLSITASDSPHTAALAVSDLASVVLNSTPVLSGPSETYLSGLYTVAGPSCSVASVSATTSFPPGSSHPTFAIALSPREDGSEFRQSGAIVPPATSLDDATERRLEVLLGMLRRFQLVVDEAQAAPEPFDDNRRRLQRSAPTPIKYRLQIAVENLAFTAQMLSKAIYRPGSEGPALSAWHLTLPALAVPASTLPDPRNSLPPALDSYEDRLYASSTVWSLVSHFFTSFVYWEPFLQLQRFFLLFVEGHVVPSLLNAILAFSCQSYQDAETGDNPYTVLLSDYIQRAERTLLTDMAEPTMDVITTACVMGMVSCAMGDGQRLNSYFELVNRLIVILNLHRVDTPEQRQRRERPITCLQHVLLEARRRCFWSNMFLTGLANLIDTCSARFDIEAIGTDCADNLDLRDFFLVDDFDHQLPAIVAPIFSASSTTRFSRRLVLLAYAIGDMRAAARNRGWLDAQEVRYYHDQLRRWFASLPPEAVITEAVVRDLSNPRRCRQFRDHSLLQLGFYLTIFLLNSESVLTLIRGADTESFRGECRAMSWQFFKDLIQLISIPSSRIPLAERPLNSFLYAWYGLESSLVYLKHVPEDQRAEHLMHLHALYHQTRQYSLISRYSRTLRAQFIELVKQHGLEWITIPQ
ncbi:hypothetical protein IWQ60_003088 [Tieghemiomyces parasiticus]|uniref:Zn(2)-C6 fungal-type domain-containing protein n=1 Tax=Tieghemiomyces parasiticus TaxID=78921 RepID=A0A9W8AI17_9FUNG|nr:hypothetical protein IWQ60_003088 [Tieghemiomyces parasiticus]